ncbi:hypothetical protein K0M31_020089 [Melipona bicolor]|uniref:Uncharacterized protein n=1 Tax=Melipona bicolor TaxID=60889 RepID=A0AA40KQE3_9HYME|nr:hypothetical protein K0M31_020089 [Melipona bicolor]
MFARRGGPRRTSRENTVIDIPRPIVQRENWYVWKHAAVSIFSLPRASFDSFFLSSFVFQLPRQLHHASKFFQHTCRYEIFPNPQNQSSIEVSRNVGANYQSSSQTKFEEYMESTRDLSALSVLRLLIIRLRGSSFARTRPRRHSIPDENSIKAIK